MPETERPAVRAAARRAARVSFALLALAVPLAACNPSPSPSPAASSVPPSAPIGSFAPTPGPTGSGAPVDAGYGRIRADVEVIRGLEPTADVEPVVIDEPTLRANLEEEFDKEQTAEELAFAEESLIALGFLQPGASLKALTLDFQSGQVAGYYSPDEDRLFVVRRAAELTVSERVTYAHEFTHQLQDQRFDLGSLAISTSDESDRSLARLALVEGDATFVQTVWTQQTLTPEELGQLLAESLDPEALAALQRAPAFLRETALSPYQDGLTFVNTLIGAGGGSYGVIDTVYTDPPASMEQVLHPEKYLERDDPIDVKVPSGVAAALGAGWSAAGEDTLGELILRIWLTEGGIALPQAQAAAAGWGGDRLVLLRGPNGATAVGLVTAWDSAGEAAEFAAAARTALDGIGRDGRVVHANGSDRVVIALGDRADEVAEALAV